LAVGNKGDISTSRYLLEMDHAASTTSISTTTVGPTIRDVALTAVAPLAWGTTYLTTTELLPPGRPYLAGVLRALPAGLMLAAFTRERPLGSWWWKSAFLGWVIVGQSLTMLQLLGVVLIIAAVMLAQRPPRAATAKRRRLDDRHRDWSAQAGCLRRFAQKSRQN
jgi:probable blue pigment (indigoidine) exporter